MLVCAVLFASLGGCFGPLMAGTNSMDCCASMPCHSASQALACCTPELPGPANQFQQSTEVTAPTVVYAVLATLPHSSTSPGAMRAAHIPFSIHCYSPPVELYTVNHSFLI